MRTPDTMKLTATIEMPVVGFGTYLISNDDAPAIVRHALTAGYRHVDTAEGYHNEEGVGTAVREHLQAGHARDALFITTKLWPGNEAWGQTLKSRAAVLQALDASLARLGLDHVDLYLIHAPFAGQRRLEQWRALVELREQGKTRAIGVSNFSEAHLEEIRTAGLPMPDANQIELHPWSQKPALVSYMREHHITPIAYSSLIPLSTWRATPDQASGKSDAMRAEGESAASPFKAMAAKYGVTEAQVLLRWAIQRGYAVLPKSTTVERIRANIDLFGFELDAEDMAAIAHMDRGDGVAWSGGDPTRAA